jgi:hypothetical protein
MAQKIPKNLKLFHFIYFSVSEKKNIKLRNYTQKKKKNWYDSFNEVQRKGCW